MSKKTKPVDKFEHPSDLRKSTEVYEIKLALGKQAVLNYYLLWEILANSPGFMIGKGDHSMSELMRELDVGREELDELMRVLLDKKILIDDQFYDCFRCPQFESMAVRKIVEKRKKNAIRTQKYRERKEKKPVKKKTTTRNKEPKPLSKLEFEEKKHSLQLWVDENAPRINEMDNPLTHRDCDYLIDKFGEDKVKEKLEAMQNNPNLLKKYVSAKLTCKNWIENKNFGQNQPPQQPLGHDDSYIKINR